MFSSLLYIYLKALSEKRERDCFCFSLCIYLKALIGDSTAPHPMKTPAPMKIRKAQEGVAPVQLQDYPINCPHQWFAWLHGSHMDMFAKLFLENDVTGSSLRRFWHGVDLLFFMHTYQIGCFFVALEEISLAILL